MNEHSDSRSGGSELTGAEYATLRQIRWLVAVLCWLALFGLAISEAVGAQVQADIDGLTGERSSGWDNYAAGAFVVAIVALVGAVRCAMNVRTIEKAVFDDGSSKSQADPVFHATQGHHDSDADESDDPGPVPSAPPHDDWWLASDGRWYPPELKPGSAD